MEHVWKLKGDDAYIGTDSMTPSGTVVVSLLWKLGNNFYRNGSSEVEVRTEMVPGGVSYSKTSGYESGNYVKFTLSADGDEYYQDNYYYRVYELTTEFGPKFNNTEKSELVLEGNIICSNSGTKRCQFFTKNQFFTHDFPVTFNDENELGFTVRGTYSGFSENINYFMELGSSARYYPYAFEKQDGEWAIIFVGIPS